MVQMLSVYMLAALVAAVSVSAQDEAFAQLGATCGGFDESTGRAFPSCASGLVCTNTGGVSIPGAGSKCAPAEAGDAATTQDVLATWTTPCSNSGKGLLGERSACEAHACAWDKAKKALATCAATKSCGPVLSSAARVAHGAVTQCLDEWTKEQTAYLGGGTASSDDSSSENNTGEFT